MTRSRFRWRTAALDGSPLQSFAYEGKSRTLEIEFRVTAPFAYHEIALPPPPRVIQYFEVPRYVFTKFIRFKTGRRQEQFWADDIRPCYRCQTVRTVCRIPRVWKFSEARNVRRFQFDEYVATLSDQERQPFVMAVSAMPSQFAALLGHSKLNMVMRYAHPQEQNQAEAVKRLEVFNAAKQIEEAERERKNKNASGRVPTVFTTVAENPANFSEPKTEGKPQQIN